MNNINKSTLGGLAVAGSRAGRQRYATEIQTSILSAEERAGVSRLSELDNQATMLINQAKQAAASENWKSFNEYQDRFNQINQEKVNTILQLNSLAQQEEDRLYEKSQRQFLDNVQKTEFNRSEASNKINNFLTVGTDIANISKDVKMEIEDNLGLPTGSFDNYYNGIKNISRENVLNGEIDTAKEMLDLLAMVPANSTIEIGGIEYPGMMEVDVGGMDTSMMTTDYKNWQLSGGQGTFSDYMKNKKLTENGLPTNINSQIDSLSKAYESNPIVKGFVEVQNKKESVKNIIDMGVGGPGDLALVFEFMKSLDPTSVVRESEYEAAAKSGNIFSGWAAKFNGYMKAEGGFLPNNVKNAFKKITEQKFNIIKSQYENYRDETARKINMKLQPYDMSDGADYLTEFNYGNPNDPFEDIDWNNLDNSLISDF